jgi:undecaprenyl-diphosphatase
MSEMVGHIPLIGRVPGKTYLVAGGLSLTLAMFILAGAFSTFPGDRGALQAFQSNQVGWLDAAAHGVTSLGGWGVAIAMMLGMIVYLALCRRRIDALIVLLSGVPVLVGFFLKEAVGRSRPEFFMTGTEPSSFSFPSGHSLFAMVFGGLLIVMVADQCEGARLRLALKVSLVLLILAVGASRVYLGVHWPSDVVAGYLFGIMALVGLVWLRNWLMNRQTVSPRTTSKWALNNLLK